MEPMTKMKTNYLYLIFALFCLSHAAQALELGIVPNESSIEFKATGRPSMLKIRGKDARPTGSLSIGAKKVTGKINVVMSDFTTGLATRDEHMKKKYLEVDKFPEALLDIENLDPKPMLASDGSYKGKFVGNLSLHGVKRAMEGPIQITWTKSKFTADSTFTLSLSDFKITVPSFAGITVANTVDVTVHAAGDDKP